MLRPCTHNKPSTAIALKLLAVFLFMVMAAMIKVATQEVPPGEAIFSGHSSHSQSLLLGFGIVVNWEKH